MSHSDSAGDSNSIFDSTCSYRQISLFLSAHTRVCIERDGQKYQKAERDGNIFIQEINSTQETPPRRPRDYLRENKNRMKDGRKEEEQQSFAEPWSSLLHQSSIVLEASPSWFLRVGAVHYPDSRISRLRVPFPRIFFDLIWWFWFCGLEDDEERSKQLLLNHRRWTRACVHVYNNNKKGRDILIIWLV